MVRGRLVVDSRQVRKIGPTCRSVAHRMPISAADQAKNADLPQFRGRPAAVLRNRHFADGTVETKTEPLFTVDEEERFCF